LPKWGQNYLPESVSCSQPGPRWSTWRGARGFAAALGDCAEGDALTTWRDRRIHVRRDATAEQAVLALAHQLAHVLLHGEIAYLGRSGTVVCRGIRKVEADSVAYLVATQLGIQSPGITFPASASWAGTDPRAHPVQTVHAVFARVLTTAARITGHLDAALGHVATAAQLIRTAGAGNQMAARTGGAGARGVQASGSGPGRAGAAMPRPRGGVRARAAATDTASTGSRTADSPQAPADQLVCAHQAAAQFFRGRLAGSWAPGYLAGRGLNTATQQRWQAGYAPAGWDRLTRHLRATGYPDTVIEAAGLARPSWRGTLIDTFRDGAMLPVRASDGTIVAFIGRAPNHAGADVPKYLNSPGTSLYRKREVLFGLWEGGRLLAQAALPVIVEGPFDAIAVTAAGSGRHVGVAPCGTALTSEHIAALGRFCDLAATGVLVAFDPDQAGRKAAVAAYHVLRSYTHIELAVDLPGGQDPARILALDGPAALNHALAHNTHPLADLVVDEKVDGWSRWLRYPEGQINALRSAAPLAAVPPSHVARQVARLAHRLGLDYATVTEAVTDALPGIRAGPSQAAGRMASRDFPPRGKETDQRVGAAAGGGSCVRSAHPAQARIRAGPARS